MKIYIIAVKDPSGNVDSPWVQSAWDEFSIDENPEGYREDIEKVKKMHKDYEVRVCTVEVPSNFFDKMFEPSAMVAMQIEQEEAP